MNLFEDVIDENTIDNLSVDVVEYLLELLEKAGF